MSWMATLYETYEQGLKLDLPEERRLIPISHTQQNAHINIIIDGEGNFRRAEVLEKKQIILPATEASAGGRTNGEAPHPLADKLQYVAQDYVKYGGRKKSYFNGYQEQLKRWCESEYSHPKVRAVYHYIEKGRVIEDLIGQKILFLNEQNTLLTHWPSDTDEELPRLFKVLPRKNGAIEPGDALVCWTVEIEGDVESSSKTWKDETLQQSWIDFDTSNNEAQIGMCFVSGHAFERLATKHPAKLRHTGDMAKLISSNDKDGFTYLGRFSNQLQACGVSFEVTQKAHNALRWLINRQGSRNGEQVIVAWAISGKEVPLPIHLDYMDDDDLDEIIEEDENPPPEVKDHSHNLGELFSKKLKKKLAGYRQNLNDHENIIVMMLDSATLGRVGIPYYRQSKAKDFFDRIERWYSDFEWPQRISIPLKNKKNQFKIFRADNVPIPELITKVAYGEKVNDKLKKSTIQRLLPCIVEQRPIPKDLLDTCVRNVSNRLAYKLGEEWRWRRDIGVACSLYKGYCSERNPIENERRKYEMSLDRECGNRDYLYGRLLALGEKIERKALDIAQENRITNAERLMQRFLSRPHTTWQTIEKQLRPYRNRLQASGYDGLLGYWNLEIAQIMNLFEKKKFLDDKPLSGEYLLGYYCQKYCKKSTSDKEDNLAKSVEPTTNDEEMKK